MSSNINYTIIDATYPVAGINNSTGGFRSNFSNIKTGLSVAATEITSLQQAIINGNKVPYIDVRTYGYVADGSTPNDAAVIAAISALPATGGAIYFPPGIGVFTLCITPPYPNSGDYSLTFLGAGADVTILKFIDCDGFLIVANQSNQYIHFMDMTLTTTNNGNWARGISIFNAVQGGYTGQNDITRVTLRGDAVFTNTWDAGIHVVGMGNINFDSVNIYGNNGGIGISVEGLASGIFKYGIVYNINKCHLSNLGVGINYGTLVQGVTVSQTNIVNGISGINLATGSVGATQLSCTLCNFDNSQSQIALADAIATVNLSCNSFYIPSYTNGIYLTAGAGITITGNSFYRKPIIGDTSSVGTGILVNGSAIGVITGNYFGSLSTGIDLTGTSTFNVQANVYNTVTTEVANIGSNSVGVVTN